MENLSLIAQLIRMKANLDILAESNDIVLRKLSKLSGNIHELKQAFTKSDTFEDKPFNKN